MIPQFGFVTSLFEKPKEPQGRARRLYTTRPFFPGYDSQPETRTVLGVRTTRATPGTLVVLCEGRNGGGFYICRSCGAHSTERGAKHKSPNGTECSGTLERLSLGHELVTDTMRLQFSRVTGEHTAYSVAYAILLGAAGVLNVPDTDLNATVARGDGPDEIAIVLYDAVPGGAGLVARLEDENVFARTVRNARERVAGHCGCDSSCYGCLRSYRNQFAHAWLDRNQAERILSPDNGVGIVD